MRVGDTVKIVSLGTFSGMKRLSVGDTGTVQKIFKNGKVAVAVHTLRQVRDTGDGLRTLYFNANQLEVLRKNPTNDPYNTAPVKPDPWRYEKVKKTRKNPARACVIYAQRKGRAGEVMYYDGRKFTNNNSPKYFGTHDRARGVAQQLVSRFSTLQHYRVWVGPPLTSLRRRNPESRGLAEAAKRLEDFSGHAARKVITVRSRSNSREGLVIGELDLIGYRTKRDGIEGDQLLRYAHDFARGSRPLLAVSKDGKQLHIVGGQYEFTEAGIEDR